MMIPVIARRLVAILFFACFFVVTHAQTERIASIEKVKPYRILTSGKQITVKSTRDITSIMVWTASGHRIIEQKEINAPSFTFRVGVNEKIFFVMLELKGERRYTEKIGVE
jgi:hypothetical protein